MVILETNNLTKVYEDPLGNHSTIALNEVDLTIHKGEFIGIMAPSGSGKTTLLNTLSGIDQQTSGEVFIEGDLLHTFSGDQLARYRRQKQLMSL